jgi:hypothetical protein
VCWTGHERTRLHVYNRFELIETQRQREYVPDTWATPATGRPSRSVMDARVMENHYGILDFAEAIALGIFDIAPDHHARPHFAAGHARWLELYGVDRRRGARFQSGR